VTPTVEAAAANNAAWCDVMARLHECRTTTTADAWTSRDRTPPLYPDAVTRQAGADPAALLARIDNGTGASVKDSFADLDLAPFGFDLLFAATWYHCDPAAAGGRATTGWRRLTEPAELARWEAAWRGGEPAARLFGDGLLDDPTVAVVADHDLRAGAILNQAAGVVGLTNLFSAPGAEGAAWRDGLAEAGALFPGRPIVGYEADAAVRELGELGCRPLGPLRVWLRP